MRNDAAFEQGNQLLAAGLGEQAIACFDACIAANPADWQAWLNRGNARMMQCQPDQALEDYLQASAINPHAASIKVNLAVLLKDLGELALADALLREVLAQAPDHADAWSNLGTVCYYRADYAQAIACQQQALALAGDSPARLNNLAMACIAARQPQQAEQQLRQTLALPGAGAVCRFNLAIALLMQGRYAEAWPYYEARWDGMMQPRWREQRWQGEALGQRTLLLWAEQGLGDTLQMVRFVPWVRAANPDARIVLAVQDSLLRLFAQLEGITVQPLSGAQPAFDCQLPLMSLPGVLGMDLATLPRTPYLHSVLAVPPRQLPENGRLKVGLVWQAVPQGGGIAELARQGRSVPAAALLPLRAVSGVDFYALQPGEVDPLLADWVQPLPLQDFADTAAMAMQLDLLITADTAALHAVAAMGKPVWVAMRAERAPFFLYQGEHSPWYDSVQLFCQPVPGDWTVVGQTLASALQQRCHSLLS